MSLTEILARLSLALLAAIGGAHLFAWAIERWAHRARRRMEAKRS